MGNKKEPWYLSMPVILISFIFYPVGIVLLIMRLSRKNLRYETIEKTQLIGGIGLFLFGILGSIIYISEGTFQYLWITLLLFMLPGGLLAYFGFKRKKKLKEYSLYLDYINARKKITLDSLCSKLNVTYDNAVNVLTEMLKVGIIEGYLTDDELILSSNTKNNNNIQEEIKSKETKIVKCKECGAKNTLFVGEQKECEYCGTILQ